MQFDAHSGDHLADEKSSVAITGILLTAQSGHLHAAHPRKKPSDSSHEPIGLRHQVVPDMVVSVVELASGRSTTQSVPHEDVLDPHRTQACLERHPVELWGVPGPRHGPDVGDGGDFVLHQEIHQMLSRVIRMPDRVQAGTR